jgi:hypothetical protein
MDVCTYQTGLNPVKTTPVRGRYLTRAPWNKHERAFGGAALYRGNTQLVQPTLAQAAFLTGSTVSSVWWALQREDHRDEIICGLLPLVPPRAKVAPAIDDMELVAIARAVGVDRMINAAAMVEAAQ